MNVTKSTNLSAVIDTWFEPLRCILDPDNRTDWKRVALLARALDKAYAKHQVGADLPPGPERSRRLLSVRRELGTCGLLDTTRQSSLFTVAAQFMCGYRDIDLRDTTGLGHGALIARHGSPAARRQWIPRLLAGELAGIAITEPHGGSNPATAHTTAIPAANGAWVVTGRKTWISRLTEAAVSVVFFRTPDGALAAAAVDAGSPGLRRQPITPVGLAGWTWGILDLDSVVVRSDDVLDGDGMELLRNHFAGYRPLVTATAVGGAAAVFDTVTQALGARCLTGEIPRVRDSALVSIGRAHAELVTALLGSVAAAQLARLGHPNAQWWAADMKAHGIDLADRATTELALLLGATGFRADSHVAKVRRDLSGLGYADGIHDSLYRAVGKQHTTQPDTTQNSPRPPQLLPQTA